MSQRLLAERANVSIKHLSRLELGKGCNPNIGTLDALAHALGCDVSDFLNGPGRRTKERRVRKPSAHQLAELCRELRTEDVALLVFLARRLLARSELEKRTE